MPKLYNYVLKRLLPTGGEEGQILTKKSDQVFDVDWKDVETGSATPENGDGSIGSYYINEDNIGHQRMMAYNDHQGEVVYIKVIDGGIIS